MCFLSEAAFINPTFRPFDGDDVGREGFFSQVDVCVLVELPEVLEVLLYILYISCILYIILYILYILYIIYILSLYNDIEKTKE